MSEQKPVALCDALRWSGAKESHGAMMFSPEQLRKFYEFASRAAPPAAPAPADPWKAAIDDELVCLHIGTADSFPDARTALKNLIDWHVSVALDPAVSSNAQALIDKGRSAAPAVPDDAALNTLAKLFHGGEEIEGDDGAAMMVDMALWNEACEAFESLIGECDSETLASSAAPAVREPQDERIRWRDAVIKEAESALRTAEQELSEMPAWANMGHAAKKVMHALAVIAALGIGGGGK